MQLHGPNLSPNVFRPLLVARHLDLDVELVAVDLLKGAHKAEAFRKLNPHGRVPVLVDGDYALWESIAIVQYLAGKKADPIWPADPQARATITSWQAWAQAHLSRGIQPVQYQRLIKAMFGQGGSDETIVETALATYAAEAAILEERLAANDGWLVGGGLTVADLDVGGHYLHAEPIALPIAPATAGWLGKLRALPAWAAAARG